MTDQVVDFQLNYFRGRVALYAMLRGLGIGPSDYVATQAFTCVAVPEGIMATGAKPLYIDIEEGGFNMDAADLRQKLTPQTKAIVVQHTYGIPADMAPIIKVAQGRGIPIIEDCCHTLKSTYDGRPVGSFGVGSFYSFEWGKPIVAGIGGSAIVNDQSLQEVMEKQYVDYKYPSSRNQIRLQLQYLAHRILYRPVLYWPVRSLYHALGSLGAAESNYNPIQAGQVAEDFGFRMSKPLQQRLKYKLNDLDRVTAHSRWVAEQYRSRITSATVSHPELSEGSDTVFARYPLTTRSKSILLREARKANVELAEWYATPIHPLKKDEWASVYYRAGSCPKAEQRCNQVVTLPVHATVKRNDIERTIRFFNETKVGD